MLKQLVSHQKLFARTRNISVTVFDSHTSEPGLLNLQCHQSRQIEANLGFLGWVDTYVGSGSENVKALITNLVDHYEIN